LYLGIPDELVKAVNSLAEDTSLSRINKDREDPLSLEGARQDVLVLLDEAVRRGASDMHFESSEKAMEVRLRIDGVLHFERSFRREDAGRVVNILFNLAEISAGDFLRFHDARFMYKVQSREVDVRLSHIPSVHGSSIVLRLLERSRAAVPLESLGYAQLQQEVIEKALKRPHGLILLTGPTGCGKTTTLYAMLNRLKGLGVKVVTVEDPVEIRMPLVTQVAADLRKGHDFHQVTRAILRHDPDVILIGEIRDELTAREAVRAAVTGHLVLSTLHTNDAVSAVLRLRDLGIDAGHIANVLLCVAAQRLVRRLCPLCKRKEGETFFPVGCPACLNGFKGRTVVSEILWVEDEARFLIEQGLTHELKAKLKEKTPLLSMEEDSRRALRDGLTSQDEIRRVIG
jgi:general secretion pathway protein E